ncbi:ComEA family DNA-binding protein [Kocuria sp.]|uniref:ComEA family DNA-binding protein n=1 Tax=Kocuria sp. TaxID=1871328 RepID=UPI0026DB346E|nr:ComEA family DNA-binding protein [Kocuria sp.]MDO4919426.1 ComEA family DNA-binding protein [Kocuria sp.]
MRGIDVRGRRRFRDTDATERLSALLREEHTGSGSAPGEEPQGGAPADSGSTSAEVAESPHESLPGSADDAGYAARHREDVTLRRRLSRPALVLLCLVLLVALAAGAVSLLRGGGNGDAVVTSAEASSDADDTRGSRAGRDTAGASHARSDGAGAEDSGASSVGASSAESGASASAAASPGGAATGGVLTVHVVGEVKDPSVVTLSPGSRVMDAVTAAGGFTPEAVKDRINLAATVTDGAQIVIPNAQNADQVLTAPAQPGGAGTGGASAGSSGTGSPSAGAGAVAGTTSAGTGAAAGGTPAPGGALVNLNTATETELEELPRVGPVLAQRIVEFRTQHGPFTAPEQLDDVSGVGPAMLESLLPLVTV